MHIFLLESYDTSSTDYDFSEISGEENSTLIENESSTEKTRVFNLRTRIVKSKKGLTTEFVQKSIRTPRRGKKKVRKHFAVDENVAIVPDSPITNAVDGGQEAESQPTMVSRLVTTNVPDLIDPNSVDNVAANELNVTDADVQMIERFQKGKLRKYVVDSVFYLSNRYRNTHRIKAIMRCSN